MVAAFKQINADATSQGSSITSLFDATGGTPNITADTGSGYGGSSKGSLYAVASAVSNFGSLNYSDGSVPGAAYLLVVSGAPGAQADDCRITTSGTVKAKALLTTGKILQIQDAGGTARYTSAAALSDGIYWVSFSIGVNSATVGTIKAYYDKLVSGSWVSQSWSAADPGAVCNTGASAATVTRFGKTSATGTFNRSLARESISQGSTAKIDPPVVNTAPTLTADNDLVVDPWQTVSTSCIANDPDETLPSANYTCTQISGPTVTLSGSGNSRQIVGGAPVVVGGTTLVFQWQVTDSQGATSNTDTQTITVNGPRNFHLRTGSWQPMRIQTAV